MSERIELEAVRCRVLNDTHLKFHKGDIVRFLYSGISIFGRLDKVGVDEVLLCIYPNSLKVVIPTTALGFTEPKNFVNQTLINTKSDLKKLIKNIHNVSALKPKLNNYEAPVRYAVYIARKRFKPPKKIKTYPITRIVNYEDEYLLMTVIRRLAKNNKLNSFINMKGYFNLNQTHEIKMSTRLLMCFKYGKLIKPITQNKLKNKVVDLIYRNDLQYKLPEAIDFNQWIHRSYEKEFKEIMYPNNWRKKFHIRTVKKLQELAKFYRIKKKFIDPKARVLKCDYCYKKYSANLMIKGFKSLDPYGVNICKLCEYNYKLMKDKHLFELMIKAKRRIYRKWKNDNIR